MDVPFPKLAHPSFQKWHEKYTEHKLPSVSTARRSVKEIYDYTIENMSEEVGDDDYLWFSIDETKDLNGNPTFTFVVGKLKEIGHRITVNYNSSPSKTAIDVHKFFLESLKVLKPMPHITDGEFMF